MIAISLLMCYVKNAMYICASRVKETVLLLFMAICLKKTTLLNLNRKLDQKNLFVMITLAIFFIMIPHILLLVAKTTANSKRTYIAKNVVCIFASQVQEIVLLTFIPKKIEMNKKFCNNIMFFQLK